MFFNIVEKSVIAFADERIECFSSDAGSRILL